jgi:hypothetical protein
MIMNIKVKKEKDVKKLFEIKKIEGIKCSSKAVSYLIGLYDENIRLQNIIAKESKERLVS